MRSFVLKSSVMALVLLLLPFIILLTNWHWTPGQTFHQLPLLYGVTQTVTRPWGTLTSILLFIWLAYRMDWRGKSLFWGAVLTFTIVWGGQGITWLAKQSVKEARPYTFWLYKNPQAGVKAFYQSNSQQRRQAIEEATLTWSHFPEWQRNHWQHEVGYAFPSGHSMFISCWLILLVGLTNLRKCALSTVLLGAWGLAVLWSRLALGMHWPQDLMMAITIAWCWSMLVTLIMMRFYPKILANPHKNINKF